jgi:nucleoside-diphosphate-sugar epimerase
MKVLIVGCGDLGSAVGRFFLAQGHQVAGVRRSLTTLPEGMQAIVADVSVSADLPQLSQFAPDVLLYCVAAGAYDDTAYRLAYVQGLRHVMQALQSVNNLQRVFFVSSTGVYGQLGDSLLDETIAPQPDGFSGKRMLEAEQVLPQFSLPYTILRLSGIYGPGRTRLLRMAQTPTAWPSQNIWSNRIHRDDAAAFIVFLMQCLSHSAGAASLSDCYIVTDDKPIDQYSVLLWLAQQMGVDTSQVTVPAITGGKRLSNQRLRSTGFSLQYADYQQGYASLLTDF